MCLAGTSHRTVVSMSARCQTKRAWSAVIRRRRPNGRSRQGKRLLQIGVALLLLLSVEGFAIPDLAAPHLGVSDHKLAGLQSVLMLALGLVWPRLDLGAATSRIAFWLFIYAAFAILAAVVLGAVWGAGNQTMPLMAGAARGSAFQETVIGVVAYSSAPTGLISFALIFWGCGRSSTQRPRGRRRFARSKKDAPHLSGHVSRLRRHQRSSTKPVDPDPHAASGNHDPLRRRRARGGVPGTSLR